MHWTAVIYYSVSDISPYLTLKHPSIIFYFWLNIYYFLCVYFEKTIVLDFQTQSMQIYRNFKMHLENYFHVMFFKK